ncbi:MAG: hypothetical protein HC915_13535 [Anaerolineae bacterium]|nr:hypothetical protein [Anaerolineae bacterium]
MPPQGITPNIPGGVVDEVGGVKLGDPNVTWTISERTFQSRYPDGMTFGLSISSSAGEIQQARVVFTHAITSQNTQPAQSINPATGQLIAEWQHDRRPPWLAVDYWWEVTDSAGNSYATPIVEGEYADLTREWIRMENDDIVVVSVGLPELAAQLALDAMVAQREIFREAWGELLPYKPRAILIGRLDVWEEWQPGLTNPNVIGTTNGTWGAVVQRVSGSDLTDLAFGTVLHEVAHLYQDCCAAGLPDRELVQRRQRDLL